MRKLVLRNFLRNRRRTFFTLASLSLGVLLLCVLAAVLNTFTEGSEATSENRVVARNRISLTFPLPESYGRRLETLEHVEAVTPLSWFGGIYKDTRPENFFAQFASDPGTFPAVFPDYGLTPEQLEAWRGDRAGFISGKALADKYGWRIGDRIFLQGEIYPVDPELTLTAIFTYPEDAAAERQIFFHRQYLEEALGNPGEVGTFWLRVDDPESVPAVISAAEAMFENSEARVKAETEKAFEASFVEMLGNVRLLFGAIGLAVVISVFLITANTMAMAARERAGEMAVLKTLGFGRRRILVLLTSESLLLGLLGGLLGVGLGALLIRGVAKAMETVFPLFAALRLEPGVAALGIGAALLLGLLSGLLPGLAQARRPIVEGLRRVA